MTQDVSNGTVSFRAMAIFPALTRMVVTARAQVIRKMHEIVMRTREFARSAKSFLPRTVTLESMQKAAKRCQGCDLYLRATQTVFGDGEPRSRIIMVGEQPGDRKTSPGGRLWDPLGSCWIVAIAEAGLDRSDIYLTNAVKHFKWEPRGKRRIHNETLAIGLKRTS